MSVLSRAAATQATHEVAAIVAALLTNTRTAAPRRLFSTEMLVSPVDPREAEQASAVPRTLLGPSGLGAAALLLPSPRRAAPLPNNAATVTRDAAAAPQVGHAPSTAGRAPAAASPATSTEVAGAQRVTDLIPAKPEGPGGYTTHRATRTPPGPTGLGTASANSARRETPIPPLYCPPPLRDDPALAAAVNDGILAWAGDIGLYEGRLEELRAADFGRLIMLAHPDCDDPDRLLAAANCAVSEWSVDDYYCEEDADDSAPDGTRSSAEAELGPRLELAAAAIDPVHLPARYVAQLEAALDADPILRAFRTSFEHLGRYASPAQLARLRTEIAGWFIALAARKRVGARRDGCRPYGSTSPIGSHTASCRAWPRSTWLVATSCEPRSTPIRRSGELSPRPHWPARW